MINQYFTSSETLFYQFETWLSFFNTERVRNWEQSGWYATDMTSNILPTSQITRFLDQRTARAYCCWTTSSVFTATERILHCKIKNLSILLAFISSLQTLIKIVPLHNIIEKKAFVYRSRHQQSWWLWPNTAARGCLSWLFRDGQVSYRSWCQCSRDFCGRGPDSAALCRKEWSCSVCEDSSGVWRWYRRQRLQTSKSFTGWLIFWEYILWKTLVALIVIFYLWSKAEQN